MFIFAKFFRHVIYDKFLFSTVEISNSYFSTFLILVKQIFSTRLTPSLSDIHRIHVSSSSTSFLQNRVAKESGSENSVKTLFFPRR